MWINKNERVDVVYSPDDEANYGSGWYATKFDFDKSETLVSKKLYKTEKSVRDAVTGNRVKWEA